MAHRPPALTPMEHQQFNAWIAQLQKVGWTEDELGEVLGYTEGSIRELLCGRFRPGRDKFEIIRDLGGRTQLDLMIEALGTKIDERIQLTEREINERGEYAKVLRQHMTTLRRLREDLS